LRAGLPKGLHWRGIDKDIHLGYRKSGRGATWLVRWYTRRNRCYQRIDLGIADDVMGEGTLDFTQAVKAAKEAVGQARRRMASDAEGPPLTVRLAVDQYIAARNARQSAHEGRDSRADAASTLNRHVLNDESFLNLRLDELTEKHLENWRNSIDPKLKGTTKRRILNDLKAALNAMLRKERRRLPPDLGDTILMGLSVEAIRIEPVEIARENQILDENTIRSIIDHAYTLDEDLGIFVLALAATGARFSQLKRMKVRDAQLPLRRLLVPRSRKGRNKAAGYTPIRIGTDIIQALQPCVTSRSSDEPLFCRWRHVQVGPACWKRHSRGAWKTASEMLRPWATICKRLGLVDIVPYALRHSSIVRGIAAGLPIRLVAAMHDTSVAMIEKHYSRWIADGLEELAAQAIVPLRMTANDDRNVVAGGAIIRV
jgi:integrase